MNRKKGAFPIRHHRQENLLILEMKNDPNNQAYIHPFENGKIVSNISNIKQYTYSL